MSERVSECACVCGWVRLCYSLSRCVRDDCFIYITLWIYRKVVLNCSFEKVNFPSTCNRKPEIEYWHLLRNLYDNCVQRWMPFSISDYLFIQQFINFLSFDISFICTFRNKHKWNHLADTWFIQSPESHFDTLRHKQQQRVTSEWKPLLIVWNERMLMPKFLVRLRLNIIYFISNTKSIPLANLTKEFNVLANTHVSFWNNDSCETRASLIVCMTFSVLHCADISKFVYLYLALTDSNNKTKTIYGMAKAWITWRTFSFLSIVFRHFRNSVDFAGSNIKLEWIYGNSPSTNILFSNHKLCSKAPLDLISLVCFCLV